jgi:hypothetical protein
MANVGLSLTWNWQLQCLPKECRLKVNQQLFKLQGTATTTTAATAAAGVASALLLLLPKLQCIEAPVETGEAYRVKCQQPEQALHVNSTSSPTHTAVTAVTPCCCCCGAGSG